MDFSISDEQKTIQEQLVRFAQSELNQDIRERDAEAKFSRQGWRRCAEMGVLGLPFPEESGGSGASVTTTLMAMEALGYGCKDAGLLFALNAQMWSVQMPLLDFGTDEQKERYLKPMISGDLIGGHGMTESDSGSDAFAMRTSAIKHGDHYLLNGSKTYVTSAPQADFYLVFGNVQPGSGFMGITAFLVDRDTPGLTVGKDIPKMGLRTAPIASVSMQDCEVPAGNVLGRPRRGSSLFSASMAWERSCILAASVGGMSRQLEECIKYSQERKQFGHAIGKNQSIANKIVEMKLRVEAARLMLYKTGWILEQGQDPTQAAALSKLYISESAVQSSLDAVQIFGGYGYMSEFEVEREVRNAIGGRLYSGTSEIQRNIIAQTLGL